MIKIVSKSLIIAVFLLFTANTNAQNCAEFVNGQSLHFGYSFNSMSKSGAVKTGKKYKFIFTLNKGKIYRFAFYASSGLNNNMEFTITDQNSALQIMYLPGEVPEAPLEDEFNSEGEYNGYDDYGNDDYGEEDYGYGEEENTSSSSSSSSNTTSTTEDLPDYKAISGIVFDAVLKPGYYNGRLTYPFFEFKPANAMNLEILIDIKELEDGIIKKGCLGLLVQDKADELEFESL